MGEGKSRRQRRGELLKLEPRCIYCAEVPTTVEHMPPISMFQRRQRLGGLEFASCESCNVGTKSADVIAGFISRLQPTGGASGLMFEESFRLLGTIEQIAPGFRAEFCRREKAKETLVKSSGGVLFKAVQVHADGPILRRNMTVFAAKLGMALYREHVGAALPIGGGVYTKWFLNAGLSDNEAKAMLSKMPIPGELKQGQKTSTTQFAYRYNCDGKSIVMALAGFHSNLHIFSLATSWPEKLEFLLKDPHMDFVETGTLVSRLEATPKESGA